MNTNHKFLKQMARMMDDAIREAISEGDNHACITYSANDFDIDVDTDVHDDIEVIIVPVDEDKYEKPYPNVLEAILQVMPEWEDVEQQCRRENEDEWQAHGFRDASDYYQWRYGNSLQPIWR